MDEGEECKAEAITCSNMALKSMYSLVSRSTISLNCKSTG